MKPDDFEWRPREPLEQQTALACWVFEEHPKVERLVKQAEARLARRTGDSSFDAYVRRNVQRVRDQVAALYEELHSRQPKFRVEEPGSPLDQQKIRTVDELLQRSSDHGCCIEYVLLLASLLRHVGLFPLILVIGREETPTHAVLGYWTKEETLLGSRGLPVPVLLLDDVLCRWHADEMEFVEATALTLIDSHESCFENARTLGEAYLNAINSFAADENLPNTIHYCIDVEACRRLNIRPVDLGQWQYAKELKAVCWLFALFLVFLLCLLLFAWR